GGGAGRDRVGLASFHDQPGIADLDLVTELAGSLRDALAVDVGALARSHVDDVQRSVAADIEHGVDARDLLILEAKVRGREAADLDGVAVEVFGCDELVALEDL